MKDASADKKEGVSLSQALRKALCGRVVLLAVGNRLKGDDGCGPAIADRLQGRVAARVLDGGTAPENFSGPIVRARPDTLLLIDAVNFSASPGAVQLFSPENLSGVTVSTHAQSLALLVNFLRDRLPDTRFLLLGIQPGDLRMQEGFSTPVEKAVEKVVKALEEVLKREQ